MDAKTQKPTIPMFTKEGIKLAEIAIDQKINKNMVTIRCPYCDEVPDVKIWGKYHERITVRCKCGYVSTMELGL